uniref:Uncharacterized protein n=1 Tax=Echeneis naucrates TaxID=173247 RepID=A0A665VC26_ECHNA
MKKTFVCNESMIITIPIGNLRNAERGEVMPQTFHCVFKDSYKLYVVNGRPKPLGAAQAITGVFLCVLGLILKDFFGFITIPSVLFVISGMVTYASGQSPNMHVAKLSFSLNIVCFFWSIVAFSSSVFHCIRDNIDGMQQGITGLTMSLHFVENVLSLFLIYWLSKAICRQHFNTLPIILLKQAD